MGRVTDLAARLGEIMETPDETATPKYKERREETKRKANAILTTKRAEDLF